MKTLMVFAVISILFLVLNFLLKHIRKIKNEILKEKGEDILKFIYNHSLQKQNINFEYLRSISKIETEELIKVIETLLKERKIKYERNSIKLTHEGLQEAKKIMEKHRTIEKYLFENTSVNIEDIHKLAEKEEHKENIEKNIKTEGTYHCIDPHGDVIKGEDLPSFPLSQIIGDFSQISKIFKILHIEDEPPEIYKKIISLDLSPFDYIKIVNLTSSKLEILTNKGQLIEIDFITSQNIYVTPINDPQIYQFFQELENCLPLITTLDKIPLNQKAKIIALSFYIRGEERRRLLELGFVKNSIIEPVYNNMLGTDPRVYKIKNTMITLRKEQAQKIYVIKTNTN